MAAARLPQSTPCYVLALASQGLEGVLSACSALPAVQGCNEPMDHSTTAPGACSSNAPAGSSDSRIRSSWECSTSGSTSSSTSRALLQHGWRTAGTHTPANILHQQLRGYAAKGKGSKAPAPPAAAMKVPPPVDPYAPPTFKMSRVPRGIKGDVLARLTPSQRALLQQLSPGSTPLRSLRQLGWPLGSKQVLGLLHDQLGDSVGSNVAVVPFVLDSMYQSASALANVVKDYLAEGRGMPQVEQFLLTTIANMPAQDIPFDGIKVAIKGRMSGKGGMTSKKVWQWGRTSSATLSDPVDYAHEAVITRAGYIGIKVWIRYKRSHMEDQAQQSSRSLISVPQLLTMPPPTALPSRSSSAWWNTPGPLQPRQHRAWDCFKPSYDPLTATISQLQQPQSNDTVAGIKSNA